MADQPTFLTPAALRKVEDELEQLKTAGREEIEARIAEARSHGDLRENADYDAAKNEQGHNEARIRHLEAMLRDAKVVEGSAGDVVSPGTVVEVRMDDDDATSKYLVGSIEERHDDFEVLSTSSPLGQALMGASPGEVVSYSGPKREFRVEVVSVRSLEEKA
jgi:transcription elongation factor GreA